jgi:hypothetical protein
MHYHKTSSYRLGRVPGLLTACAALAMLVTNANAQTSSQVVQLSTRMSAGVAERVGIGGFIITGTTPKSVVVRAIGPSLLQSGIPGALADPVLELHGPSGWGPLANDNWRDMQEQELLAVGLAPTNNLEPAIWTVLAPGAYTAVVRSANGVPGTALVEVYDLNPGPDSKLSNISTRAFCDTNSDIIIAGLIISGGPSDRVVIRGIGPSLASTVGNVLANPALELRDNNGTLLVSNNDWQDNPVQAQQITAAGLGLTNSLDCAVYAILPPGRYTALLYGSNNSTGNGLVEVYDLGAQITP